MADGTQSEPEMDEAAQIAAEERRKVELAAIAALPAIVDAAKSYGLTAKAYMHTMRMIAMPQPHTDAEFVSCALVAYEHKLNPLTKEIYFMRDKRGNIQAIVSVDGWIKKCNEHPQFDGIEFVEKFDAAGDLFAIEVAIYRKDRSRPTKIVEYLSECMQVYDHNGPWKTHKHRMMRNRGLCQCSRIAFGFAGLMERDEFDQWMGMRDVTPERGRVETKQSYSAVAAARAAAPKFDASDIPDEVAPAAVTIPKKRDAEKRDAEKRDAEPPVDSGFVADDVTDVPVAAVIRQIEREIEANPLGGKAIAKKYKAQIEGMDQVDRDQVLSLFDPDDLVE